MHETIRRWISDVLTDHRGVMSIALRQRAKFEGWLKFELAAHAEASGATTVIVEAPLPDGGRSDLSFNWDGVHYDVELKTPNTNWRVPGIANITRPVTKNLKDIVADARKATSSDRRPLIAFVLFPVRCGDHKWYLYLERIGGELDLALSHEVHAIQLTVPISKQHVADVVICCFPVSANLANDLIAPTL